MGWIGRILSGLISFYAEQVAKPAYYLIPGNS
jgi:hypothetical protein